MKGLIDKVGFLSIVRGRDTKPQKCRFTTTLIPNENGQPVFVNMTCGDWCPLFREPVRNKVGDIIQYKLGICDGVTLIFDSLDDNRVILTAI
jgi:hypothetical protein